MHVPAPDDFYYHFLFGLASLSVCVILTGKASQDHVQAIWNYA